MRFKTRLAVALAFTVLGACGRNSSEEIGAQKTEVPDETIMQFTTEESDSGRVRWRLTAPRADRYTSRNVFLMDDPTIEFYDEFGLLQTTLTSEHGEYSQVTSDLLAYGDVVVVSVQGDVLETDSLQYLNEEDKIVSDSFVRLRRGDDIVTGYGLECDHTLDSVDIKRDVKATIREDGKALDE